ncbi:MAG: AAA family ATPase [Alphaproteobacteria bacterium]|jgi:cobaltochelatase CobS
MFNKNSIKEIFGLDFDISFSPPKIESNLQSYIPKKDDSYFFDAEITKALLAGFAFNKRVLVYGLHGSGKSSHIEQIANRLAWPCVRVNLDGHIGRIDLIGRDVISLKDGKQITEFKQGILPWAMEKGVALIFDEYDAGRPEVMFVLQRVLESEGKLTLSEENRIIEPHPNFRLFATANTIGLGDETGLYHGTNMVNQGQLDRWNIIIHQDYIPVEKEIKMLLLKIPKMQKYSAELTKMVGFASLTRNAFKNGDLAVLVSPRTMISWCENLVIFGDLNLALKFAFLNKCDANDLNLIKEFYQRAFNRELE